MILETLKFESEISDQKRLIGERERQAPNIENRRESFLSVQAPLGNPVLAVANGLLLFTVEHREFTKTSRRPPREKYRKSGDTRLLARYSRGEDTERKRRRMGGKRRVSGRWRFTLWQIHIDHNGSAANGGVRSVTRDLH